MRINELVKVGERTEQRVIHHEAEYAEDGSVTREAWDETVEVQVPVMGMVNRDATPEEISEFERQQVEMPEPEMTTEERLAALERAGLERDAALIELAAMLGGA